MNPASGCRIRRCLLSVVAALAVSSNAATPPAATPTYDYQIIRSYPHDPKAFTQGLFYRDGFLYESTGRLGQSTVRKVRLDTGEVLARAYFPSQVFGEGITDWHDRIVALTWFSQVGFVLDLQSLTVMRRFPYAGEGWGLTHDDRQLIMSDGTPELRFLDPTTLSEVRRLPVTADGVPVKLLNELEWVDGEIFSNIWQSDLIARIDPASGRVVGWIDLTGLLPQSDRKQRTVDVLNGIAYDRVGKRLFVTGKLWPRLYEIQLVKRSQATVR